MGVTRFLSTVMPVKRGANVTVFKDSICNSIESIANGHTPFVERNIWEVYVIQNAGTGKALVKCLEKVGTLNTDGKVV